MAARKILLQTLTLRLWIEAIEKERTGSLLISQDSVRRELSSRTGAILSAMTASPSSLPAPGLKVKSVVPGN